MIGHGDRVLVVNKESATFANIGLVVQVCIEEKKNFYHLKSLAGHYMGVYNAGEVIGLREFSEDLFLRLDKIYAAVDSVAEIESTILNLLVKVGWLEQGPECKCSNTQA